MLPDPTIRVRHADRADLDALAALMDAYRSFYGQPPDRRAARDFLEQRLHRGESVLLIASAIAGPALGFTQLYPSFSSVSLGRIFVLNDLFVIPEARRRGVASGLLDAAAAHAREAGALRLSLSTAVDNTAAQTLYSAKGWTRETRFHTFQLAL